MTVILLIVSVFPTHPHELQTVEFFLGRFGCHGDQLFLLALILDPPLQLSRIILILRLILLVFLVAWLVGHLLLLLLFGFRTIILLIKY